MKKLIILGAGGQGRVVADCARAMGIYDSIGFLDASYPERTENLDWPIIDTIEAWEKYLDTAQFFIGIGNSEARLAWLAQLKAKQANIATIIHPTAVCSPSIKIGVGTCVFANAVLNPAVSVGEACIINTGSTVDHDCTLSDGVHISPGANLAGTVSVGRGSWVGVGASVIQCISITSNTMIGAGAAVVSNIEEPGTYVGVPAKKIK